MESTGAWWWPAALAAVRPVVRPRVALVGALLVSALGSAAVVAALGWLWALALRVGKYVLWALVALLLFVAVHDYLARDTDTLDTVVDGLLGAGVHGLGFVGQQARAAHAAACRRWANLPRALCPLRGAG